MKSAKGWAIYYYHGGPHGGHTGRDALAALIAAAINERLEAVARLIGVVLQDHPQHEGFCDEYGCRTLRLLHQEILALKEPV